MTWTRALMLLLVQLCLLHEARTLAEIAAIPVHRRHKRGQDIVIEEHEEDLQPEMSQLRSNAEDAVPKTNIDRFPPRSDRRSTNSRRPYIPFNSLTLSAPYGNGDWSDSEALKEKIESSKLAGYVRPSGIPPDIKGHILTGGTHSSVFPGVETSATSKESTPSPAQSKYTIISRLSSAGHKGHTVINRTPVTLGSNHNERRPGPANRRPPHADFRPTTAFSYPTTTTTTEKQRPTTPKKITRRPYTTVPLDTTQRQHFSYRPLARGKPSSTTTRPYITANPDTKPDSPPSFSATTKWYGEGNTPVDSIGDFDFTESFETLVDLETGHLWKGESTSKRPVSPGLDQKTSDSITKLANQLSQASTPSRIHLSQSVIKGSTESAAHLSDESVSFIETPGEVGLGNLPQTSVKQPPHEIHFPVNTKTTPILKAPTNSDIVWVFTTKKYNRDENKRVTPAQVSSSAKPTIPTSTAQTTKSSLNLWATRPTTTTEVPLDLISSHLSKYPQKLAPISEYGEKFSRRPVLQPLTTPSVLERYSTETVTESPTSASKPFSTSPSLISIDYSLQFHEAEDLSSEYDFFDYSDTDYLSEYYEAYGQGVLGDYTNDFHIPFSGPNLETVTWPYTLAPTSRRPLVTDPLTPWPFPFDSETLTPTSSQTSTFSQYSNSPVPLSDQSVQSANFHPLKTHVGPSPSSSDSQHHSITYTTNDRLFTTPKPPLLELDHPCPISGHIPAPGVVHSSFTPNHHLSASDDTLTTPGSPLHFPEDAPSPSYNNPEEILRPQTTTDHNDFSSPRPSLHPTVGNTTDIFSEEDEGVDDSSYPYGVFSYADYNDYYYYYLDVPEDPISVNTTPEELDIPSDNSSNPVYVRAPSKDLYLNPPNPTSSERLDFDDNFHDYWKNHSSILSNDDLRHTSTDNLDTDSAPPNLDPFPLKVYVEKLQEVLLKPETGPLHAVRVGHVGPSYASIPTTIAPSIPRPSPSVYRPGYASDIRHAVSLKEEREPPVSTGFDTFIGLNPLRPLKSTSLKRTQFLKPLRTKAASNASIHAARPPSSFQDDPGKNAYLASQPQKLNVQNDSFSIDDDISQVYHSNKSQNENVQNRETEELSSSELSDQNRPSVSTSSSRPMSQDSETQNVNTVPSDNKKDEEISHHLNSSSASFSISKESSYPLNTSLITPTQQSLIDKEHVHDNASTTVDILYTTSFVTTTEFSFQTSETSTSSPFDRKPNQQTSLISSFQSERNGTDSKEDQQNKEQSETSSHQLPHTVHPEVPQIVLVNVWNMENGQLVLAGQQPVPVSLFNGSELQNGAVINPEGLPLDVMRILSEKLQLDEHPSVNSLLRQNGTIVTNEQEHINKAIHRNSNQRQHGHQRRKRFREIDVENPRSFPILKQCNQDEQSQLHSCLRKSENLEEETSDESPTKTARSANPPQIHLVLPDPEEIQKNQAYQVEHRDSTNNRITTIRTRDKSQTSHSHTSIPNLPSVGGIGNPELSGIKVLGYDVKSDAPVQASTKFGSFNAFKGRPSLNGGNQVPQNLIFGGVGNYENENLPLSVGTSLEENNLAYLQTLSRLTSRLQETLGQKTDVNGLRNRGELSFLPQRPNVSTNKILQNQNPNDNNRFSSPRTPLRTQGQDQSPSSFHFSVDNNRVTPTKHKSVLELLPNDLPHVNPLLPQGDPVEHPVNLRSVLSTLPSVATLEQERLRNELVSITGTNTFGGHVGNLGLLDANNYAAQNSQTGNLRPVEFDQRTTPSPFPVTFNSLDLYTTERSDFVNDYDRSPPPFAANTPYFPYSALQQHQERLNQKNSQLPLRVPNAIRASFYSADGGLPPQVNRSSLLSIIDLANSNSLRNNLPVVPGTPELISSRPNTSPEASAPQHDLSLLGSSLPEEPISPEPATFSRDNIKECAKNSWCALGLATFMALGISSALMVPILGPALAGKRRKRGVGHLELTQNNAVSFVTHLLKNLSSEDLAGGVDGISDISSKYLLDKIKRFILTNEDELLDIAIQEVKGLSREVVPSKKLEGTVKPNTSAVFLLQLDDGKIKENYSPGTGVHQFAMMDGKQVGIDLNLHTIHNPEFYRFKQTLTNSLPVRNLQNYLSGFTAARADDLFENDDAIKKTPKSKGSLSFLVDTHVQSDPSLPRSLFQPNRQDGHIFQVGLQTLVEPPSHMSTANNKSPRVGGSERNSDTHEPSVDYNTVSSPLMLRRPFVLPYHQTSLRANNFIQQTNAHMQAQRNRWKSPLTDRLSVLASFQSRRSFQSPSMVFQTPYIFLRSTANGNHITDPYFFLATQDKSSDTLTTLSSSSPKSGLRGNPQKDKTISRSSNLADGRSRLPITKDVWYISPSQNPDIHTSPPAVSSYILIGDKDYVSPMDQNHKSEVPSRYLKRRKTQYTNKKNTQNIVDSSQMYPYWHGKKRNGKIADIRAKKYLERQNDNNWSITRVANSRPLIWTKSGSLEGRDQDMTKEDHDRGGEDKVTKEDQEMFVKTDIDNLRKGRESDAKTLSSDGVLYVSNITPGNRMNNKFPLRKDTLHLMKNICDVITEGLISNDIIDFIRQKCAILRSGGVV